MKPGSLITINSRKFDRKIHRSWKAALIEENETMLSLVGEFPDEIRHPKLGVIRRGTISYEFFWKDRWFNVFRFHEPEGELRNFYCNINQPPRFSDGVLDYIDLEIDVLVWKNFSVEILDLDEFEENARVFNFPERIKRKAHESLDEILKMIDSKQFPFDFE